MVLLTCYSLPRSRVAIKSEAYVSDNAPESAWVALKRCQETQNSEMNGVGLVKACNRVGRKRGCQKGTLFTDCKNWLESRRRKGWDLFIYQPLVYGWFWMISWRHVLHVLYVIIITWTEWRFTHPCHFWCLFSSWMKCSKTLNNGCFGWNFETRYSDTAGSSCLLICSWKPFQSFWCTSLQRVTCSPEFDPKR